MLKFEDHAQDVEDDALHGARLVRMISTTEIVDSSSPTASGKPKFMRMDSVGDVIAGIKIKTYVIPLRLTT